MPTVVVYLHIDPIPSYISPDYVRGMERLQSELDVDFSASASIQEIMAKLSDPFFKVDVILIDIEELHAQEGASAFDLVQMLGVLAKCTLCREGSETNRRQVKLATMVTETVNIKKLKEFMKLADNLGVALHNTRAFSYEEIRDSVAQVIQGSTELPPVIKRLQKSPPKERNSTDIRLTPRECQILGIIQERGASNKVIARMLDISESTVKLHIGKVLKKYGVKNRTQLAVFSKRNSAA